MFKCELSFKNRSRILKEEVLECLVKFERSKLNVLLRVLRANVVFNRPVTTQRLSKVIKLKVLSFLTGWSIKRKSQVKEDNTSPNLTKKMIKKNKI